MAEILERGDIFFVYRPKVQTEEVEGLDDVQRLYTVLKPQGRERYREIVIGRKRLPDVDEDPRGRDKRQWAYVERVVDDADELERDWQGATYSTKTRGERHQPPARPAGEGVYVIARHEGHTHLAYVLELPTTPGEAQRDLDIEPEASYVATVKNPDSGSPPGAGLPRNRKADLPDRLRAVFGGRSFADLDPPELLDYPGTELVLIAATRRASEELGIAWQRRTAEPAQSDTVRALHVDPDEHPIDPLTRGEWS